MRELKTFMSANSHQVLSAREARASLDAILEQVSRYNERVIIASSDGQSRGVLISEAELEALEQALEILSGTPNARAMRGEVIRIATAAASMASFPANSLS